MTWKTYVELANGEEDWVQTRNCFVRAFQNYPLYKHIIRDDKKRPEFLKQYLEAIYEVTVRKGNSILICGKAVERDDETATVLNNIVIGGVLFVPPASNGGGWECQRDEDFWDAYEKYKLKDLDGDAFEKLQAYEIWEYENISKHICNGKIPMWNGILCGVDPVYAGKGCGSLNYKDCLNILSTNNKTPKTLTKSRSKKLLNTLIKKFISKACSSSPQSGIKHSSELSKSTLLALSHSHRAVHFHEKNGFKRIAEFSYFADLHSQKKEDSELEVTVLMLSLDSSKRNENKYSSYFNFPKQKSIANC